MTIAALIIWFAAVLAGLYMLAVWLIENDSASTETTASRLPAPVLFGHFALAFSGLVVWVAYLITDRPALAWTAFGLLVVIATLGATMFLRWIPVYREPGRAVPAPAPPAQAPTARLQSARVSSVPPAPFPSSRALAVPSPGEITLVPRHAAPTEGSFPVVVVAAHGLLGLSALILVLLAALGAGGS